MQTYKIEGLTEEEQKSYERQTLEDLKDLVYFATKKHPFYCDVLSKFHREINYRVPICDVSFKKNKPVLYINPIGFNSYSKNEQVYYVLKTIVHVIFRHFIRSSGKDLGVIGLSADIAANQVIESDIAIRPIDALMPHHFNLPEKISMESYYDILWERDEPITLPPSLSNTLLEDILKGEASMDNSGASQASKKAPGFENLHPTWDDSNDISKEIADAIVRDLIRSSISKFPGNIPGGMTEVIDELFKPQVRWTSYIRSFAASVIANTRRSTWSRPSRRYGNLKMGKLREKKACILVAIDTSGSLQSDHLQLFLSEIKGIRDQTGAEILICQCDTNISSLEPLNSSHFTHFEVHGRGGTDLCPPFELAEKGTLGDYKLTSRVDGIIYLTDGYGPAPESSNFRTLWVLTPDGRAPYTTGDYNTEVSFGKFITLTQ
jgi:predicted metal-dependent peptidase